jgi:hypothetical protein
MSAEFWNGCHRARSGGRGDVPVANADANPDHPFYGLEVVFTGALGSMTRARAWDRVAAAGADTTRTSWGYHRKRRLLNSTLGGVPWAR